MFKKTNLTSMKLSYQRTFTMVSSVSFLLLSSCSYSPGMNVSGVMAENYNPNRLQRGLKYLQTGQPMYGQGQYPHYDEDPYYNQHRGFNNHQRRPAIEENIPRNFVTRSGVNVEFQNLHQGNIPRIRKISNNNVRTIRSLLKYKPSGDYRITSGDAIAVNSWAYPEIFGRSQIGNSFSVPRSGYISLPLIGRVQASGKTQDQLSRLLVSRYRKYLKQPDIDLKIVKFNGRSYSVQGKVRNAGEFIISDKATTLMSALSQAGGLVDGADSHKITLTRNGRNYRFSLPALRKMRVSTANIFLKSGDNIHVDSNDNRKVYLIGELNKPTFLTIPENGLSLASAIGQGQGINSKTANPSKIYIVRNNQTQNLMQIYRADLSKLENLALANQFEMMPNDIVYVDATGLTRWNRVLSQILSSASAVRTGQTIGTGFGF